MSVKTLYSLPYVVGVASVLAVAQQVTPPAAVAQLPALN